MTGRYWIETLGCAKNAVDSDKLAGSLLADGYLPARDAESADLVVVNTCAFIEAAREESVETILDLAERRHADARLVVTGCLAARSGPELAAALPEVDLVADVGVPVQLRPRARFVPATTDQQLSLMELARPPVGAPWAYLRVAEGCDRACGFCAIPSFRGPQRSRPLGQVLEEAERLAVEEIVLVSQDLASYGRDLGQRGGLIELVRELSTRVERVRLLYLYPSALTDDLIAAMLETKVPYFDLSLQHVSSAQLRRMRRFGSGARFLRRIAQIRGAAPEAAFRSSFIVGYPGETEEDHDQLLEFLNEAALDWVGLFAFSEEAGTYAVDLPGKVPSELVLERLREASEPRGRGARRAVGRSSEPRSGYSWTAPASLAAIARHQRLTGSSVPTWLAVGRFHEVVVERAEGPDLLAAPRVLQPTT